MKCLRVISIKAVKSAAEKHEDDCCNNETKLLQMDTDYTDVQTSNLKLSPEAFVAVFIKSFILFDLCDDLELSTYQTYKPPLPNQELYILIEQYLI